jgi:cytochrome c oxidase subunit II
MNLLEHFGLMDNYSAHGGQVDHLMNVIHWFMLVLFIGWTLFFFYAIWRFWHRRNAKASYEGVRSHLSSHLEIGVIIIEAVLLLGFAFPLWAERVDSWSDVQDRNPVRVRVVGWQFGWTYHYPGSDGKFGRTEPMLISGSNDLGIDYTDPNALDDFTTGILTLPNQRPAVLNIGSKDVIHNYAIKPMRIQQDAIPGKEIPMWFTPTRTMETYVICAQLCGEGHANMVGSLEVIPPADFQAWFDTQSSTALAANQAAYGSDAGAMEQAPLETPPAETSPAPAQAE